MRMAPKGRFGRVGAGQAGREGDFAIALRTPDIARAAAGRRRRGEFARLASAHGPADRGAPRLSLTPLNLVLAAFALAGCAAVGPNFERPAAIVSPQFKEIKGWKIATPRESEPKGAWWSVFDDPELDRLERVVVVSNQTVKADEASYREALALINEARAGLFPTVEGTGSATRSSPNVTTLTAEASGMWTLDIWGQVRREIEAQQAGAELSAATLANVTLTEQSLLALAYMTLREADLLESLLEKTVIEYKHSLTITQNQYNAGTAAKSDVITAETLVLNAQAMLIAAGVSRAQSEHAIAVLMGRPPAGLSIPHGSLATKVPSVPVGLPSSLLERTTGCRRGGGDDAPSQRHRSAWSSLATFRPSRSTASSAILAIRSRPPSARPIPCGRSARRLRSRCSTAASRLRKSKPRARPTMRTWRPIAKRC